MKAIGVIATVLVASAVMVACAKQTTDAAKSAATADAVKVPAKVFGTGSLPIEACTGVSAPQAGQEYDLSIGKDFTLTDPKVAKSGHKEGSPHPQKHKTVLDIVMSGLNEGQSATVKISLDDDLLSFPDTVDLAVRGNDASSQAIFCGVTFGPSAPGGTPRYLTFTVHRDAGGPTYATYNLGLVATDKKDASYKLPVFIDPGVDNNG
jgi:hypothetical protein